MPSAIAVQCPAFKPTAPVVAEGDVGEELLINAVVVVVVVPSVAVVVGVIRHTGGRKSSFHFSKAVTVLNPSLLLP